MTVLGIWGCTLAALSIHKLWEASAEDGLVGHRP